MMKPPPLDALQRWMMSVITHPQGVEQGVASETAQREFPLTPPQVDQVILPSEQCTSFERLAVYNNAYFARLIECLATEFPAVRHVVGEEAFAGFVVTYLRQSPPRSYTLGDLGRGFAASLRATRPPREPDNQTPDWADFLIDLATLERLYSDVFDGPGEEGQPTLNGESLRLIPADRWPDIRLTFAKSLRQARFRFPVHEYITQVRHGNVADIPEAVETFLIVHRRDYVVRRVPVHSLQFQLIGELRAGRTLAEAMESSLEQMDESFSPAELQNWFHQWTAAGFFTGITIDEDSSEPEA